METKWLSDDFNQEKLIIAGDIGGTNTNLAVVGLKHETYTILLEMIFSSSKINGLIEPIQELIKEASSKSGDMRPKLCCISAAGAVSNNFCQPTNCSWAIDGKEIEKVVGIKTVVINDFLAISYGIPTLDVNNPDQITVLKHTDGSSPEPQPAVKAVVGPGTGLGVSYIAFNKGEYIPCSSEGGHSCFAPYDEESGNLREFIAKKYNNVPGIELFVSGQGICNIHDYYREVKGLKPEGIFATIDAAERSDRPALISKNAGTNATCREIMELFVKMFAAFSSNIACIFMPFGGLYLAGGPVIKNQHILVENDLFMSIFEQNYQAPLRKILKQIPVYIIKDYSISLYGAANGAVNILGRS